MGREQDGVNEQELFHYAPPAVVEALTASSSVGFDPRLGNGEYGCGCYFAQVGG
jgi:hypothetical protein